MGRTRRRRERKRIEDEGIEQKKGITITIIFLDCVWCGGDYRLVITEPKKVFVGGW